MGQLFMIILIFCKKMNITYVIIFLLLLIIFVLIVVEKIPDVHKNTNPEFYSDHSFKIKGVSEQNAKMGKEIASSKKIVLCGLCRNIEQILLKNIEFFESIGEQFQEYKIILFENDSEDKTRDIIKQKSIQNPNIILLDCGPEYPDCKFKIKKLYDYGSFSVNRIKKMASFRNLYLNYIKQNISDYDYVLMMDMDIEGYFNMNGLMEVLSKPVWDAVFINGRVDFVLSSMMYDILAYIKHNDNYDDYLFENTKQINWNKNWKYIKNKIQFITDNLYMDKWTPVKSAFNGCGIYKMDTLLSSDFIGDYKCEWINFHKKASDSGKGNFFIARDWVVYVGFQGPKPISVVSNYFKNLFSFGKK